MACSSRVCVIGGCARGVVAALFGPFPPPLDEQEGGGIVGMVGVLARARAGLGSTAASGRSEVEPWAPRFNLVDLNMLLTFLW